MVYGNFISLIIYIVIVLLAAIFTGIKELYFLSIFNFVWLYFQYKKKKLDKKLVEYDNVDDREISEEMDFVINMAKEKINNKYANTPISDEEKKDMVWKEVINILGERKK
jgi:hypothetical protein